MKNLAILLLLLTLAGCVQPASDPRPVVSPELTALPITAADAEYRKYRSDLQNLHTLMQQTPDKARDAVETFKRESAPKRTPTGRPYNSLAGYLFAMQAFEHIEQGRKDDARASLAMLDNSIKTDEDERHFQRP